MDREKKRQSLENKKKRWMQDREQTLDKTKRDEIRSPPLNTVSKGGRDSRIRQEIPLDESLLSQLTERITQEIKKEINIGIGSNDLREVMTEKMDKYLESELHSHMCKICSCLMVSPSNTPMLLFPCGHTFCRVCCEKGKRISICPYCRFQETFIVLSLNRQEVQSMTVNQSLKDLIDQFASQRERVRNDLCLSLPNCMLDEEWSSGGISADVS